MPNSDDESAVRTATPPAEDLYTHNFEPLRRFFIKRGVNAEDAEDLTHDVLIGVIYVKIHQFELRPDSSFQSWLFTVARNHYLNWRKREQRLIGFGDSVRANENDDETDDDQTLSKIAEFGATLLSEYTRNHQSMFDNIHATMDIERQFDLAGLTAWERLVVQLKIYWDLKPADIAAIIEGQTADNVSRTFYNAKVKLGKRLAPDSA